MKTRFIKIEMKDLKVFLFLVLFISIFSITSSSAFALPTFSSLVTVNNNTEYSPGKGFSIQINITDNVCGIACIVNATFETNMTTGTTTLQNFTKQASQSNPANYLSNNTVGIWWINLTQEQTAGAGTYVFKWYAHNGTAGAGDSQYVFIILPNSTNPVNLYLNTTLNNNRTYTYPEAINATGAAIYSNSGTLYLYRDGVQVATGAGSVTNETLLGNGTYAYKVNITGNQNYTSNETGVTYYAFVNKGPTLTKLYLNGTEGNVSYNLTQVANFTVTLNVSVKNVSLSTTITGWGADISSTDSSSTLTNLTTLNTKGVFNITGYFPGDENYTASSQTWYATVADVLSPKWSNQAQNASTPLVGAAVSLSAYWTDDYGLSYAILSTNETGSWQNKTANYSSPTSLTGTGSWSNFTWQNSSATKGTVVGWRIYANDTSNNWNVTDIMTFTVKAADGTSCTASNECIGGYCVHGICRSSSTYCGDTYCDSGEDCSSCTADCGTCPSVSPTPPWVLYSWDKILPGAAVSMNITKTGLDFSQIEIKVKNQANQVSIKVEKLAGQPAEVTHTVVGKAYQWIKITPANLNETNIETAKIRFKVNQSWISDNNVDPATVALNRWESDHWSKLPTTKLSEDTTYVYYESQTPGFSVFAITGETVSPVTTTTTTMTTIPTTTTTTTLPPTTTTIPPEGKPSWAPVIVIIIIIGIVLGYLYWLKRYRPATWFKLKKSV
jgi:PGF-pre-PGF domain-containing protein